MGIEKLAIETELIAIGFILALLEYGDSRFGACVYLFSGIF